MDKRLLATLNAPGVFGSNINNSTNIGKYSQDLAEIWNKEHPEDLIQSQEMWDRLSVSRL
jgi:hypothetical protein